MLEREKSIIIISTTISICIMLLTGINESQGKKTIHKGENTKNQTQVMIDKPKNVNDTNRQLEDLDEDKIINTSPNEEKIVVQKKTEKPIEKNNIQSSKSSDNNKNESPTQPASDESLKRDENTEKTSAVFKVNREDIFSELSFVDKEKLLLISTKLKASDYKKISDLLEEDVDGQGVLSSLKILKARLSGNDYSKIKEIFNKFINMDLVDN